jgi:hypothetical protein
MELGPGFASPPLVDGQPSLPFSGPNSYQTYIEEQVRPSRWPPRFRMTCHSHNTFALAWFLAFCLAAAG